MMAVRVSNGGFHPSSRSIRAIEYGFSPRMNDIAELPRFFREALLQICDGYDKSEPAYHTCC